MSKIVINGQILNLDENSGVSYVVEEYDVAADNCDWHVRKWNNGYVELSGMSKSFTVSKADFLLWGDSTYKVSLSKIPDYTFPIKLTKKYSESILLYCNAGDAAYLSFVSPGTLEKPTKYTPTRPDPMNVNHDYTFTFFVTGCWKDISTDEISQTFESQHSVENNIQLPDIEYAPGSTAGELI